MRKGSHKETAPEETAQDKPNEEELYFIQQYRDAARIVETKHKDLDPELDSRLSDTIRAVYHEVETAKAKKFLVDNIDRYIFDILEGI